MERWLPGNDARYGFIYTKSMWIGTKVLSLKRCIVFCVQFTLDISHSNTLLMQLAHKDYYIVHSKFNYILSLGKCVDLW